ncbi:ribonuclease H-like domain-containing protein [Tanacetum coccineum]
MTNNVPKGTSQREVRPVWNNALRTNHQNFSNSRRNFAPTAVLTKSGIVPISTARQNSSRGDLLVALKDTRIFNSRCSRHMTGNKSYLSDYQDYDRGFVAFAGSSKGELKFNLFSVSHMCDWENSVLFTETECLILSPDFKLPDESQVMLKIPRKDNMYIFDLKNIVPSKGLTCLFSKAINDESKLWHRRLGHIKFKTMNKLVKGNLVRGLPLKIFENDHTCVACQKGKQHKATLDFLAGSHIMYALTANPTIYVSLIEQFWQTATVETVNDGEQHITVIVDEQTIAITEASVRRHLQLADVDGISSLPDTEIFEQLTLMGPKKTSWE